MDLKNTDAPVSTITYDRNEIDAATLQTSAPCRSVWQAFLPPFSGKRRRHSSQPPRAAVRKKYGRKVRFQFVTMPMGVIF